MKSVHGSHVTRLFSNGKLQEGASLHALRRTRTSAFTLAFAALMTLPVFAAERVFKVMSAAGTAAVTLTDAKEEFTAAFVAEDFEPEGSFSRKE